MASSSTYTFPTKEKPVVVRVKRKVSQESLDAFWLEINGKPPKRLFLGFENLSLSNHEVSETLKTKRLLVQHVETVSPSEAIEDVLQSLLPYSASSENLSRKSEARKGHFRQYKKQQLRSVARQEHEELVRRARFEQIWKSRRGESDSLREFCHLYDVVRVDGEDEKPIKEEPEYVSVEDHAILCNYLPLLRECIPSAAEEMEAEIKAYLSREENSSDSKTTLPKEDGYVYDLYTVEEFNGNEEDISSNYYPSIQVKDEEDYNDMSDSEYDSEDSNAENHPRNDYPEEETSDEEDDDEEDPFGDSEEEMIDDNVKDEEVSDNRDEEGIHIFSDSECSDSENEEDEDSFRWGYR